MDTTTATTEPAAETEEPRTSALQLLLELSAPTFGWFRTVDAAKRGVTADSLTWLRSRGAVETPWRGCNRLTGVRDTWEGRALGRQWAAGPYAALGRDAALRILDGGTSSPDIDVVLPRHRASRRVSQRARTHVRLEQGDILQRGVFRVTSPLFTVGDLAAVMHEHRLRQLADRHIAVRAYSIEEFAHLVDRFRQVEGVETLRAVLEELHPASRWTRSDGERMWLLIVRQLDVAPPTANVRVEDGRGDRRYLDFAWEDLNVAVEIDLHPSHGTTLGRREDGARQNALVLAGWTVLRFDLYDLMRRPDQVRDTIARALANAVAAR